ncbi:hypothetical protein [Streptosporangium carneum]|nr:hypothetical protein [Streptosporangium carneum]
MPDTAHDLDRIGWRRVIGGSAAATGEVIGSRVVGPDATGRMIIRLMSA